MNATDITIADFKAYFVRDFDYYPGTGCEKDFVNDGDLTKALDEANVHFNEALFSTDAALKIAFLNLAAHCLATDLQASAQGVNSVGYAPVASRGVGSVNESYQIPDWVTHDSILSAYNTTRYGQKYLQIIRPLLVGGVVVEQGTTTA
jgi:hypothetical protein